MKPMDPTNPFDALEQRLAQDYATRTKHILEAKRLAAMVSRVIGREPVGAALPTISTVRVAWDLGDPEHRALHLTVGGGGNVTCYIHGFQGYHYGEEGLFDWIRPRVSAPVSDTEG